MEVAADLTPINGREARTFGPQTAAAISNARRRVALAVDRPAEWREALAELAGLVPAWIDNSSFADIAQQIAIANDINERIGDDAVQMAIAAALAPPPGPATLLPPRGDAAASDPPAWLDEAPPVAPTVVEVRPTAWQWCEPQAIPPRRWLYGRHHVRRFVSATIAPGGMTAYRIVTDPPGSTVAVGSVLYRDGNEVGWPGWPIERAAAPCYPGFRMVPLTDLAERITAYSARHLPQMWGQKTPFDQKTGRYYLPATRWDPRSIWYPPLPKVETEGMPRYRMRGEGNFGGRVVKAGSEFAFLGWPTLEMGLTPINEPAQQIVDFYEQFRGSPALPPSPWNLAYGDGGELWLPEMPGARADAAQRTADEVRAREIEREQEAALREMGKPKNTRTAHDPFKTSMRR